MVENVKVDNEYYIVKMSGYKFMLYFGIIYDLIDS